MELTIIIGIVIFLILFIYTSRKKVEPVQTYVPPRPEIFEDSTLLKQQFAELEQKYTLALKEVGQLQNEYKITKAMSLQQSLVISDLQRDYAKLQHQKKSSEVKTGAIAEVLAPVMTEFPFPTSTLKFLGQPIDYISFDYDQDTITFVEVKSGKSQYGENQRRVKKMVEQGKVKFATVRIDETGVSVK